MELLPQAEYRRLLQKAAAGHRLVLEGCQVLQPGTPAFSKQDLAISGSLIAESAGSGVAERYNASGLWAIPGLCDAHVHVTACTANLPALLSMPESLVAARAAEELGATLLRGFTTVRDCGGADYGLAQAVEEGFIVGPRLLFVGHALSQTGGHGDFRGKGEDCVACGAALRGLGAVCDGDMEVRRASRDELRKGAHCIKIMASGGVSSPTDKLTSTQFSEGELRAIVEEAEATGTYVCAHAYTAKAILRCLRAGVRSIEHGNYLDAACADLMKEQGGYLVPTLVTYKMLVEEADTNGLPKDMLAKVGSLYKDGLDALGLAHSKGVPVCNGSDLLGDMRRHQSQELLIAAQRQGAAGALRSATENCAQLFQDPQLGQLAPGAHADLVLLSANPLEDISILADPSKFVAVFKGGIPVCSRLDFGAAEQ